MQDEADKLLAIKRPFRIASKLARLRAIVNTQCFEEMYPLMAPDTQRLWDVLRAPNNDLDYRDYILTQYSTLGTHFRNPTFQGILSRLGSIHTRWHTDPNIHAGTTLRERAAPTIRRYRIAAEAYARSSSSNVGALYGDVEKYILGRGRSPGATRDEQAALAVYLPTATGKGDDDLTMRVVSDDTLVRYYQDEVERTNPAVSLAEDLHDLAVYAAAYISREILTKRGRAKTRAWFLFGHAMPGKKKKGGGDGDAPIGCDIGPLATAYMSVGDLANATAAAQQYQTEHGCVAEHIGLGIKHTCTGCGISGFEKGVCACGAVACELCHEHHPEPA